MAELTYFKKFNTKSEYDTYIDGTPILPNVSIVNDEDVYFKDGEGPEPPHDYSQDYLTFVMLEDGGMIKANLDNVFFSKDSGATWVDGEITGLSTGDEIFVKSDAVRDAWEPSDGSLLECTKKYNVKGNILSIYNSQDFRTRTRIDDGRILRGCLSSIFYEQTNLISAENLVLPATALTDGCYNFMFQGCTGLTSTPELPATTLANDCYYGMFQGCTSLTTAPELPATTLASNCYVYMFKDCTNLTTAPELPVTALVDGCYYGMFQGCTNLNYIKCLATNIPATNCTYTWVSGVASTGTFVKNANMSSWETGNNGIPTNWSVQDA